MNITYSEEEEIIRATWVNALHSIETISIVHLFEAETENVVDSFPKIFRFLLEALEKREGNVKIAGSIAKESLDKWREEKIHNLHNTKKDF